MTSSKFRTIPISDITILREERQRRELEPKALEELARSIEAVGLINPITVDENEILVAGERRLTACRDILGWTSITVQYIEDAGDDQLKLVELEENVRRKALEWKDECKAIQDYHIQCSSIYGDDFWSMEKTAAALNVSKGTVVEKIEVSEALDEGVELVVNADKYSVARGVVQRRNQRRSADATDAMDAMLSGGTGDLGVSDSPLVGDTSDNLPIGNEEVEPAGSIPHSPEFDIPFAHANFIEWVQTYSGPKFNFLHCDFPYGVNADKHDQGAAGKLGGYEDSPEVYWQLLQTLNNHIEELVAPSAHMMFWFSMDYYHETKESLEAMGWRVNPFPIVWTKGNVGILPDPKRGGRRTYETAFLCSRGDRFVVQPVALHVDSAVTKEVHMSEKHPDMLAHFFRMFVDDTTVMLDPTMGSGNAVRVAEAMGAKTVLGLEKEEEFYTRACEAYTKGMET